MRPSRLTGKEYRVVDPCLTAVAMLRLVLVSDERLSRQGIAVLALDGAFEDTNLDPEAVPCSILYTLKATYTHPEIMPASEE